MLGRIIRGEMLKSKRLSQLRDAQINEIPGRDARDAKIKNLMEMRDRKGPAEETQHPSMKDVPINAGTPVQDDDSLNILEEWEKNYTEVEAKRRRLMELFGEIGDLIRKRKGLVLNPELVDMGREISAGIIRLRGGYLRSVFQYETKKYLENHLFEHTTNVALLSIVIGLEMKYDQDNLFNIFMAAIFHDIGILRIGLNIINKPSDLNLREKRLLSVHPIEGSRLFEEASRSGNGLIPNRALISKIISQGHERVDGSGYPYRLKEDELHPLAMILGISDTFESLTHPRPYREQLSPLHAFRKLFMNEEERRLFTRGIRKTCFAGITPYPPGTCVSLNTGDRAVVIDVDPSSPLNPVILIREVGKENMIVYHPVIDLRKNNQIHINHNGVEHFAKLG